MNDETGNLPAKTDEQPPDLRVLVGLVSKALELETTMVAVSTKEAEIAAEALKVANAARSRTRPKWTSEDSRSGLENASRIPMRLFRPTPGIGCSSLSRCRKIDATRASTTGDGRTQPFYLVGGT